MLTPFPCSRTTASEDSPSPYSYTFILWKPYDHKGNALSTLGEGEEIEIANLICSNSAEVPVREKIKICTEYDKIATEFSDWCRVNTDALKINITTKDGLNKFRRQMGLGDDDVELNPRTYLDTVQHFQAKVPFRICCFGSTHMNLPLASFFAFSHLSPYGGLERLGHHDFERLAKESGSILPNNMATDDDLFGSLQKNKIWELSVPAEFIIIKVRGNKDESFSGKMRRLISNSMLLDACTIGFNQAFLYRISHIANFITDVGKWSDTFDPQVYNLKMWSSSIEWPVAVQPFWDDYCDHPGWKQFKEFEEALQRHCGINLPIIPTVDNMIFPDNLTPNQSRKGEFVDPVEINKVYMFPRLLMLMFEMVHGRPWQFIEPRPTKDDIEKFLMNYMPTAMRTPGHNREFFQDEDNYPYFAALFMIELMHASQVHGMNDELIRAFSNDVNKKIGKYIVHTLGEKMCLCVHILYTYYQLICLLQFTSGRISTSLRIE